MNTFNTTNNTFLTAVLDNININKNDYLNTSDVKEIFADYYAGLDSDNCGKEHYEELVADYKKLDGADIQLVEEFLAETKEEAKQV